MSGDQAFFDYAKQRANESRLARFMARLWYVPWLPVVIRKAGMRFWNERYDSYLPAHLRRNLFRRRILERE